MANDNAELKSNFNSIKVRLKHGLDPHGEEIQYIFQFHKGTIKTFSLSHLAA